MAFGIWGSDSMKAVTPYLIWFNSYNIKPPFTHELQLNDKKLFSFFLPDKSEPRREAMWK